MKRAERFLRRIEKRGHLEKLDEVFASLQRMGATKDAGVRLDDPTVCAHVPRQGPRGEEDVLYRRVVVGRRDLLERVFETGDETAFGDLVRSEILRTGAGFWHKHLFQVFELPAENNIY